MLDKVQSPFRQHTKYQWIYGRCPISLTIRRNATLFTNGKKWKKKKYKLNHNNNETLFSY